MRFVKRQGSEFVVRLEAHEIETLYDALDARNDRLEEWRNPRSHVVDVDEARKLDEDLSANEALSRDFQPLIKLVRGEKRIIVAVWNDGEGFTAIGRGSNYEHARDHLIRALDSRGEKGSLLLRANPTFLTYREETGNG